MLLFRLFPPPSPVPFARRYDSLDSATNGRSDIDSGSGSSRRTSRQYSLDSRHSLSDRWVSVPPLQFSSCCSSCSGLWLRLAVTSVVDLSCPPRWLCLHACALILSLYCIFSIYFHGKLPALHLVLLCYWRGITDTVTTNHLLHCLNCCLFVSGVGLGGEEWLTGCLDVCYFATVGNREVNC